MGKNRIVDEVYIAGHHDFVNIDDKYYGGDQKWLSTQGSKSKFWADRSCGAVAATNVICYIDKFHNKKVLNVETLDMKDFIMILEEVYEFITPRVYGIPSIKMMVRRFTRFAKSKGIKVYPRIARSKMKKESIIEFIKKGLKDDNPIMMITWNTKVKNLEYHWVTITGYYKNTRGENFVVASNWGKREVFDLDFWIEEKSLYKGLIYFEMG